MPLTITADTLPKLFDLINRRLEVLENTSPLGAASATAGTSRWKDASAADQIVIGLESDGTYAVWVGAALKIQATGPNAGQILGLVALSLSGPLSANGGISTPDHNGSQNVPTAPVGTKIFVQNSDPGAAANNGDIWINTT